MQDRRIIENTHLLNVIRMEFVSELSSRNKSSQSYQIFIFFSFHPSSASKLTMRFTVKQI